MTTATKPHQPLSVSQLSRYISQTTPSIPLPIQTIQQFTRGQSNPTYLLTTTNNQRYVLRKKPPGGSILSKTAHDVEREYKIMSVLGGGEAKNRSKAAAAAGLVPVPKMYGFCKDESVLGEVFYIMAFVDGRVFDDWRFLTIRDAGMRREMWRSAMHTLANIHLVPLSSLPSDFQRQRQTPTQEDFYTRQLRTLSTINAKQSQTLNRLTHKPIPSIPYFQTSLSLLSHHLQTLDCRTRTRTTLIHNDYKINNLIYHPATPDIIAVLDWELATVGNPLADLANLLAPFISPPGEEPGVLLPMTREDCLDWYAERSGWRPSRLEMGFADAFAALRNSVIIQGIVARSALGQGRVGKEDREEEERGKRPDWERLVGEYGEFTRVLVGRLDGLRDGEEGGGKVRSRGLERL